MEKQDLLNHIQECLISSSKIQEFDTKLSYYYRTPKWFYLLFAVYVYGLFKFFDLVGITSTGYLIVVGGFTIITNFFIFGLIARKVINPALYRSKINALKQSKRQLLTELLRSSFIPSHYLTLGTLTLFEKYLMNYRADNLKECINLFEAELKHDQLIHEQREIQAEIRSLSNEIASVNSTLQTNSYYDK